MTVYYVKSRYAANGRFKHLSTIRPLTLDEARERIVELGGPNQYLAIYNERDEKIEGGNK